MLNPTPRCRFAFQTNEVLGFTLIELLTSITILALLAAVLISGVQSALVAVKNAKCLSNLRTTGTAALLYFTDNNGEFFPDEHWYILPSWEYPGGMVDYLGIKASEADLLSPAYAIDSVLTCPTMKSQFSSMFPLSLNRCYTMNYFLHSKDPSSIYDGEEQTRPPLMFGPRRLINVPNPSSMWMFTDGAKPTDPSDDFFYTFILDDVPSINLLSFPHHGRQNVVFVDGHVESLTKNDFLNPPSVRAFWGDLRVNN